MDKLRRREDLLRAARVVFARKGYHEAKVDDIAAAARVGKGTVYLYFSDKSSIMQELLDRILVVLEGAILKIDTHGDLAAQIKHNIRAIVAVFLDDPTMIKLLLTPLGGDPDFQKKLQKFMLTVHLMISTAMADGQRLGIVAHGPPEIQAAFALGALKELLAWAAANGSSREDVVLSLYDMLSSGCLRFAGRATDPRVSQTPSRARKPTRAATADDGGGASG